MPFTTLLHSRLVQNLKVLVEQGRYGSSAVFERNAARGNAQIAQAVKTGTPAAIGKLGSTELQALRGFLRTRGSRRADTRSAGYRKILLEFSGVFPDDYDTFRRWGTAWAEDVLPAMTHMGAWFNFNESWIIRRHAPQAHVFHSRGLEPYIFPEPWSDQLKGKRVVVVSPFSKSIELQYPRRAAIWNRLPSVLPDFDLRTVQCPTYPHLVKPVHPDWFAALADLERRICQEPFDVLLVGAGAYSLPLCAFAKSRGKIGIHLGGNTQLLFGILGKRWLVKQASIDHRFFNDSWIYPLPEDTPDGCRKIENGCYWK